MSAPDTDPLILIIFWFVFKEIYRVYQFLVYTCKVYREKELPGSILEDKSGWWDHSQRTINFIGDLFLIPTFITLFRDDNNFITEKDYQTMLIMAIVGTHAFVSYTYDSHAHEIFHPRNETGWFVKVTSHAAHTATWLGLTVLLSLLFIEGKTRRWKIMVNIGTAFIGFCVPLEQSLRYTASYEKNMHNFWWMFGLFGSAAGYFFWFLSFVSEEPQDGIIGAGADFLIRVPPGGAAHTTVPIIGQCLAHAARAFQ